MSPRQIVTLAAAFASAVAAERSLLAEGAHGDAWWSHVPGFFALFGLVACLALIFVAKTLVKIGLQREPSYYDEPDRNV